MKGAAEHFRHLVGWRVQHILIGRRTPGLHGSGHPVHAHLNAGVLFMNLTNGKGWQTPVPGTALAIDRKMAMEGGKEVAVHARG